MEVPVRLGPVLQELRRSELEEALELEEEEEEEEPLA